MSQKDLVLELASKHNCQPIIRGSLNGLKPTYTALVNNFHVPIEAKFDALRLDREQAVKRGRIRDLTVSELTMLGSEIITKGYQVIPAWVKRYPLLYEYATGKQALAVLAEPTTPLFTVDELPSITDAVELAKKNWLRQTLAHNKVRVLTNKVYKMHRKRAQMYPAIERDLKDLGVFAKAIEKVVGPGCTKPELIVNYLDEPFENLGLFEQVTILDILVSHEPHRRLLKYYEDLNYMDDRKIARVDRLDDKIQRELLGLEDH